MKKCGLRKAYSLGGELQAASEMNDINWASNTNDPDILNAQFNIREKQRALEEQQKYGKLSYRDPVGQNDIAKSKLGLDAALRQNGFLSPAKPQQPALQQPQLPMETTFQQDIDDRQQRMAGYRAKLGYAGGGTIDPDALMREMAAKYGTSGAQPQAAAPAPQPVAQPAPAQAPQPKPTLLQGLRRLATGNLEGRMKAAGFKQGGTVDGKGYIHGEKGVDKVPAKVAETGEDILVSDGERIVNKKQNAALERLAAEAGMSLDEYLERSTGEPVGPQMKKGLRAAEQGWNRVHMPGDRVSVDFNPAPAPNPARASSGKITPYQEKLDPEALMRDVAKRHGLDYVPPSTPAAPTVQAVPATDPDTDGRRQYSPGMNSAFNYRGGHAPAPQPAAQQISPNDERFNSVDRRTPQEQATAGAQAGLEAKGLRNAQQFLGGEGAAVPAGLTTTRQTETNAPLTKWVSKDDVAAASIKNNTPVENGTGIVTMRQKDGTFKNVVIGQSEYTGADGKPTSDWSKTQQYADAVTRFENNKAQLKQIQRERAEFDAFDPSITDPAARQNGLRQVAMNMMKDEAAGKALQHKEDRDAMLRLRRDMLEEQKRQFDETASARRDISASAAKERGIQNMEKLFEFSGLKGDRANNFRQFVYQNHADNLSALPHEQQLKVLPRLIADFEDAEIRNANSTNGTSWQNQKVKAKDSLNFEEDAAYDPNGVLDQRVWFGSGADGKGLGKANILLRKYGPTALFGSADVDVMEDGQRVMSKDNRGERGMLGSRQMKEINRLSLRDGDK